VAGSAWRRSFHAGPSNRDQTFDTAEEKEEMEVNSKRLIRLLTKLLRSSIRDKREVCGEKKPVQRSEGSKGITERNKKRGEKERLNFR
jgi:hypothetical protein